MLEHVGDDVADALGRQQDGLLVDALDELVGDAVGGAERLVVVDLELQDVAVLDGVHDRVGVEPVAEGLLCGQDHPLPGGGVLGEDRRTGETEDVVFLELPDDGCVHLAELAAVALVEDDDDVLAIDVVGGVLLDEYRQLLDGRDQDADRRVLQLPFEDLRVAVAVDGVLLETVVLLHRLVVQVLAVDDEQHLVDALHPGDEAGGLEGGQGLAGSGGVPNVATTLGGAPFLVVGGLHHPVDDGLRRGDLVGAHHEEGPVDGEDAVPSQDVQQGVPREERRREVLDVRNVAVLRVGPVRGELEGVAGVAPGTRPGRLRRLLHAALASRVGVVLGVGAVADDKNLHVLEQAVAGPEGLSSVAVDLVERLPDVHPAALQLDVDHRQAVDEDGDVVAVAPGAALGDVLVDDLGAVPEDVLLVDETDVPLRPVVHQAGDGRVAFLDHLRLLDDAGIRAGELGLEEPLPFAVGEGEPVEFLYAGPEVGHQFGFRMDRDVVVALGAELLDEPLLHLLLALVAGASLPDRLVGDRDGRVLELGYVLVLHHRLYSTFECQKLVAIVFVLLLAGLDLCRKAFGKTYSQRIKRI